MKRHLFITGCCVFMLMSLGIATIPATTHTLRKSIGPAMTYQDEPPVIEIVNPTEGYFHFSGIKLFPTILNLVGDTMGFGGFRLRPVQVRVTDDVDEPEDLEVYMYVYDNEQGDLVWNNESQLFERKWIGPDLGDFILNVSATDTGGNTVYAEMAVWYFCFVPE
ncbi:MAG: hypothetical protein JXA75_01960 [Candidatus Thermoplasmatota archaeon]|nr:hypothetical protein [Candidatus Thermoplasmatota archaeon]